MHLLLVTRGINQSFEVWKKFMETQMFNWKRENLNFCECGQPLVGHDDNVCKFKKFTPRVEYTKVQGALRPIQLFEYVFPKESLQEVLAMMNCHKNYNKLRPEMAKVAWILRKGTGAEVIPDMPELENKESYEITQKYVPMQGMAVYPVGIRKDAEQEYPQYGYRQEGL